MFSSYLASITEHSFLCICKVFISKEFVRFSYGLGRFYASKRIIQSKDANVHAHSLFSAVQPLQCPFSRRWIMCNPFQGSNSLRGAKNLFREIENSLRGTKNLFREIENSLRGAKNLFREIENSLRGAKNLFREIENFLRGANNLFWESETSFRGEICNRLKDANKFSIVPSTCHFRERMDYLVLETMNKAITSPVFLEQRHLIERVECFCPSAFVKAVPGRMPSHISRCYLNNAFENTEYDLNNMSNCNFNDSIFLSENQRYNCPISWCSQSHRHSGLCSRVKTPRIRDRDPSRMSLRKCIHSLRYRN